MQDATIVLVHGLAIMRRADAMFSGVGEALAARGYRVARTDTQGDGTLTQQADRVWQQIERLDAPVVLLCHSMGGLQARTFLLDDARASRIRGIATLGSPHHGTWLSHFAAPFQKAYAEMTPPARSAWMSAHGAAELAGASRHGVRCLSAVAALRGPARHAELLIPQTVLERMEGPNDGLVSGASQRWGEIAFEVDLDHIECAAISGAPPRAKSSIETWVRLADLAAGRSDGEPVRVPHRLGNVAP